MSDEASDVAEQFEKAFNTPKQTWLLAAGASFMSNIPLMYPLTRRVLSLAKTVIFKDDPNLLSAIEFIKGDIDENAHIEIFLTHLADLISMSVRSRNQSAQLGDAKIDFDTLTKLHNGLLERFARSWNLTASRGVHFVIHHVRRWITWAKRILPISGNEC